MESSEVQQWWIRNGKGEDCFGPVSWPTVQKWAREGRLGPDSEVSCDKAAWEAASRQPGLGMDWIAAMPEGRLYGPIHHDAAAELMGNGGLPEGTRLFHVQPLEVAAGLPVRPVSRAFLGGRAKALRLALRSSRAARENLLSKAEAEKAVLSETLRKEAADAKEAACKAAAALRDKERELAESREQAKRELAESREQAKRELADLRGRMESERAENLAGLERARADCEKRIGELSGHLEDARQRTEVLVKQVERIRKEAADAESAWRDKLREQAQTVVLCETEGKAPRCEPGSRPPEPSPDPIVIDAEVVGDEGRGARARGGASASSSLADLERQLQWELSQLGRGQNIPDFLKR